MVHIVAGMAAKHLLRGGRERAPEQNKRTLGAKKIGAIALVSGLVGTGYGFATNFEVNKPVKSESTVHVGDQTVREIDLALDKQCDTAFTTSVTSMAKYVTKVAGIDVAWRSQTVEFENDTALCLKGTTVKASLDSDKHHITIHVDPADIYADTYPVPGTVFAKPDMSMTQVVVENITNVFRGTPFVQDFGPFKDAVRTEDNADSFLRDAAMTKGMKATADNCTPQVWSTAHDAFERGLANRVLLGARLYDQSLTADSVTVLVGEAATSADNVKQQIGRSSNVDKANDSLQKVLDAHPDSLSADQGSVGKCEVPASVTQAAQGGGNS